MPLSVPEMPSRGRLYYRHKLPVRIMHWINVIAVFILLMSGLQIFNAHPALYFGSKSTFDDPVMSMRPMKQGEQVVGVTTIAGWKIETTGIFGVAYDEAGDYQVRGFPWSVTLPQVAFGIAMSMAVALYVFAVKGWLK